VIEEGYADDVSLEGLNVALSRYHDDEPGSPWSFVALGVRAERLKEPR
jgi:hypothetical protein